VPSTTMSRAAFESTSVAAAAVEAGLVASKGEAVRLIKQGGVYLNGERVSDDRRLLTMADTVGGKMVVFSAASGSGASYVLKGTDAVRRPDGPADVPPPPPSAGRGQVGSGRVGWGLTGGGGFRIVGKRV
jgi:hypothetical protein